jgi:hypothetical protein
MLTTDGGIVAAGPCPGGVSTTITGKIYDPAAKNVLYGAVAYVPSAPVSALQLGASCDTCSSLYTGSPIAAGQTDATGSFVIQNAPSGTNVPLIIQLGKWRKKVSLNTVVACVDNPQPDKSLTLPATHMEGDIPNIAISTGGADTLECLLLRMGVAASEYEPGGQGPGRIHIFQGSGASGFGAGVLGAPNTSPAAPTSSSALWNSTAGACSRRTSTTPGSTRGHSGRPRPRLRSGPPARRPSARSTPSSRPRRSTAERF